MPRAVSYTYRFTVLSVRLIITNLAPAAKPQSMFCAAPVPEYVPTFETPARVAKRYATMYRSLHFNHVPMVNTEDVGVVLFHAVLSEADALVRFKYNLLAFRLLHCM